MPVFLLSFLALFGVSHASDTESPEPSLWLRSTFRSVCKPIPSTLFLCHGIGYRSMWIPNILGHDSLREVQQQSAAWLPLISKHCHRDTKKFLCSLFAPVCLPELSGPVSPCRSLCEAVRDGCVPVMSAFGFPWPYMFNCTRFPHGTELCIPTTEEQDGRETEMVKHEEVPKGQCTELFGGAMAYGALWLQDGSTCTCPGLDSAESNDEKSAPGGWYLSLAQAEEERLVLTRLVRWTKGDKELKKFIRALLKQTCAEL
uniref:Secreted frizzled-related protein 2 like n=1 Tax=Amphilophus citrinellus TaxID=61819 RepID=A0A3Q0RM25_AMPCI